MKKSYISKLIGKNLFFLLFLTGPFFVSAQNYCDTITLEANIPDTVFLCSSDSIQINADAGFVSYQWSRGDTTATVDLNYSGMYWLTVTDDSSCVEVDSVL
ncbi:MAG: hypothetical protein U9R19_01870, partial [Bacteroidota bacterium]|nr:hypothetical protein [Bacteroidota bacterium]